MKKIVSWKSFKNIGKVVITLIALYWLSTKISWLSVKEALISSNYYLLFAALITYSASIVIGSSRLNDFFQSIGLNISERYNLRLYQLGLLYNFFLPGGIGGDGYKIFFLKKNHNIKGRQVLSAVFFDRLSGLWALCIIICTLIIFMPRLEIPNYLPLVIAILGTLTYYYFLRLFFKNFARKFIKTHVKALMVQGLQTLTAILILYSLGFDGKYSPYLLIFLLSSLVAVIPTIGGGVGLRELVAIYSANYIQLDSNIAVVLSLMFYIISLLVATSGIYYVFRPKRLGAHRLPSVAEVENVSEK